MDYPRLIVIVSCLFMPTLPAMSDKPPLHRYEFLALNSAQALALLYTSIINALDIVLQDKFQEDERRDAVKDNLLKALETLDTLGHTTDDFRYLKDCALERSYILEALQMINQKVRTQLIKLEPHKIHLQYTQLKPPPHEKLSPAARALRVINASNHEAAHQELKDNPLDDALAEELIKILFMLTALGKAVAHDVLPEYKVIFTIIDKELREASQLINYVAFDGTSATTTTALPRNDYYRVHLSNAYTTFSNLKKLIEHKPHNSTTMQQYSTINELFCHLQEQGPTLIATQQEIELQKLLLSARRQCSELYVALKAQDAYATRAYQSLFKQKWYCDESFPEVSTAYRELLLTIDEALQYIIKKFDTKTMSFDEKLMYLDYVHCINQAQGSINDLRRLIFTEQDRKKRALRYIKKRFQERSSHENQHTILFLTRLIESNISHTSLLTRYFDNIDNLFLCLNNPDPSWKPHEVFDYLCYISQHVYQIYEVLKFKTQSPYYSSYFTQKNQSKVEAHDAFNMLLSCLHMLNAQKTLSPTVHLGPVASFFDFLVLTMNRGSAYCTTQSQFLTHQINRIEKFDGTLTHLSNDVDIPDALAGILQARRSPGALKVIEYCLQSEFLPAQAISQVLAALAPEAVDTIQKQLDQGQPLSVIADELRRIISTFHLDDAVDQLVHFLNNYKPQVMAISSQTKNFAINSSKQACTTVKNKFDRAHTILHNNANKFSSYAATIDGWHYWCNSFASATAFCTLNLIDRLSQSRAALLYTVIDRGYQNPSTPHPPYEEHEHARTSRDEDDNCEGDNNAGRSPPTYDSYDDLFQQTLNSPYLKNKDQSRIQWLQQILNAYTSPRAHYLANIGPKSARSIINLYKEMREIALKNLEMQQDRKDFKKLMEISARFPKVSAGVCHFFQRNIVAKEQELWRHWLPTHYGNDYTNAKRRFNKKNEAFIQADKECAHINLRLQALRNVKETLSKRLAAIQAYYQGYFHFEEFPAIFWLFDLLIWPISYVKQRPFRKALASIDQVIQEQQRLFNPLQAQMKQAFREKNSAQREKQRQAYILQQISLMSSSGNERALSSI